jgi:hypothetical protein
VVGSWPSSSMRCVPPHVFPATPFAIDALPGVPNGVCFLLCADWYGLAGMGAVRQSRGCRRTHHGWNAAWHVLGSCARHACVQLPQLLLPQADVCCKLPQATFLHAQCAGWQDSGHPNILQLHTTTLGRSLVMPCLPHAGMLLLTPFEARAISWSVPSENGDGGGGASSGAPSMQSLRLLARWRLDSGDAGASPFHVTVH